MKKYRAGKIKREHSVIEQLWPVLEQIAECDLVTSIIPGPIRPLNTHGFEVTFQRFTETGLRLLAKAGPFARLRVPPILSTFILICGMTLLLVSGKQNLLQETITAIFGS